MYKILIVDDEPLITEGLKHFIIWEEHGIEIVGQALNGEQAIALLDELEVNILLTDIKMPKVSGLELIEYVKKKEMDIKCVILSGYDDFDLVKQAALLGIENYLLKPVDRTELSTTMLNVVSKLEKNNIVLREQIHVREAIHTLKDNILLRLVSGNISMHELLNKASFLNIDMGYEHFIVSVIRKINSRLEIREPGNRDDGLINYAMRNICEEIIAKDVSGFVFNDLEDDIIILSMSNAENGYTDLLNKLDEIMKGINNFLKQDVFITVGSAEDEPIQLDKSYYKAKALQDYSLIYPINQMITYGDIEKQKDRRESEINIDFDQLKQAIDNKNKPAAVAIVKNLYERLDQLENGTPSLVQSVTIEVLYHIINNTKLLMRHPDILLIDRKDMLLKVMKMRTIQQISDWVINLTGQTIDLNIQDDHIKNPVISEIINYMETNYSKELSLQALSHTFHVNAAYLGQLFKKETGQMFTAYLNKLRVEKAKHLLSNRTLKATAIAQEVGYHNTNYFFKIFKKITGVYPSEFK
ncbi:MAG TPA: response regulator transcription factor [Bacilli bacterium]